MEDPQQRTAAELLDQQGRHKAQFITSAILRYIQSPGLRGSGSDTPMIDKDALEQMLLTILEKHPQFVKVSQSEPVRAEQPQTKSAAGEKVWDTPIGEDAMLAISETLAAFQQG